MSTSICSKALRDILTQEMGHKVRFDEPLGPYLWYKIGGPADVLAFPENLEDLERLRTLAETFQIPLQVLGSGTNLLVVDEGLRGIVIRLEKFRREIKTLPCPKPDHVRVRVSGGVHKPELLEWATEQGLTGLEFSSGVPGTIGGGIFMNAGTKYGSYGDILESVEVFDFTRGVETLLRQDIHFGYRESFVKNQIVLSVDLLLQKGDSRTIQAEVDRIIEERAQKQPLDFPSCGSTFKNPPGYSAGRLIEKSGLKGSRRGGAEISTKHANFILNKDHATAKDVLALIDLVQKTVFSQFGVKLECEVIILGQDHARD